MNGFEENYMILHMLFVSYLILTLIIRRFVENATIFNSQFACYVSMMIWAGLHVMNNHISKCWLICKLYGLFLQIIRVFTILFIKDKLQWQNPDLYLGADWTSNQKLMSITSILTGLYAVACLIWSILRQCTHGPRICLTNIDIAYQAAILIFLSAVIQLILAREFYQKSRLLRQRLHDSPFWISKEVITKIKTYNYTCVGIILTDVIAMIIAIVYLACTENRTYSQKVSSLQVINVIMISDHFINSILMTWTTNWRSLSLCHLICTTSPYGPTIEEVAESSTATDEENSIPLGATARSLRWETDQNTLQNQGGMKFKLANGQEIILRPIQHSGTASEVAAAKRRGIRAALEIEESSETPTTDNSSGVEMVFPEGYLEKE